MIAPHELKNKSFNKAVRGYNAAEVDEYLEFLIDKYTEAYRRNCELENELRKTKSKYSELHHDEDTIRAVIVKAQKLGENIVKQAKAEAEAIIEATKEKCSEKIVEAEKKIIESRAEIEKAKALSDAFKNSLYEQYVEHLKALKALSINVEALSETEFKNDATSKVENDIEDAKGKVFSLDSEE